MKLHCDFEIYNLKYQVDIEFEKLKIVGPSGSGKSTLLKCIHKMLNFSGTIKLNNKENFKTIFMLQNSVLFDTTVYNNLYKVQEYHNCINVQKMYSYLERCNLINYLHSNVNILSGGQYQRICIIRSLLLSPDCFLFDEPTSALDKDNILLFNQIFSEISVPIIYITHNQELNFGQTFNIQNYNSLKI